MRRSRLGGRLFLGLTLASLPPALLAQPLDQRPTKNDSFTQAPGNSRVIVMPPPDDQTAPMPPDDAVTATPPQNNPGDQAPLDNSVISTPLPPAPPPDDQTDSTQQTVPNPLDNSVSGTSKQAQPQGQPVLGGWLKMGSATLQALDKVNAVEKTLVVKVGDSGRFDTLDIAVRGCFVRPPDRPADATALLVIRDQRADAPAFNGWMVRSAPYMSMMAHPIYDVRITGCSP